ncbi:hypothetical protein J3D55_001152 [Chryseobacterium ginsenosidimutans]|uniref:hypothetical protein n=1 Tax=Chryseobacterium ginsenosidimutans TaxID=687846 RepID=UPI00216826E5|nr:hypothetical protein [Chryseobacterium ginsenosidimutans]MCS3868236.1 hypothetical protein [Chryseobacterium ginsenosidimutans]
MKYFTIIIVFLYQFSFGQNNDIEIKILNDTIKNLSTTEYNSVCYSLTNNSDHYYYFILDDSGFNSGENNAVDAPYVGLLDYRVFEKDSLMQPLYGNYDSRELPNFRTLISKKDSRDFKKKYKYTKRNDLRDINISYWILKNTFLLAPKSSKKFCAKIIFPHYYAPSDNRTIVYDMKNNGEYYFQIFLQNPEDIVDQYFVIPDAKYKDAKIFRGIIYSNKVPLLYNVNENATQ